MKVTRRIAVRAVAAVLPVFLLASCALSPSSLTPEERIAAEDFSGIVSLSNCSGALVRFTRSKPEDPALVMTNGHCAEEVALPADAALADRPADREFRLVMRGKPRGVLRATSLVYATMTGTDIAMYRVAESYEEIERRFDAHAWTLAENPPLTGAQVFVVSGYWHRRYDCRIEGFAYRLKEQEWTFADAIRYDEACDLREGTSGAPVIDSLSRKVVGINNTGNNSGARCMLNNPCEIDETGRVTVLRHRNYGQQTYLLYGCLDAANRFDFSLPACRLPRPDTAAATRKPENS